MLSIALICRQNLKSLNLVVRVRSFFSLLDGGQKTYVKGKTLPTQRINIHNYSLLQLVDFIAEHYIWGSKQHITLSRESENTIEIKSDEQLFELLRLVLRSMILRPHCIVLPRNIGVTHM